MKKRIVELCCISLFALVLSACGGKEPVEAPTADTTGASSDFESVGYESPLDFGTGTDTASEADTSNESGPDSGRDVNTYQIDVNPVILPETAKITAVGDKALTMNVGEAEIFNDRMFWGEWVSTSDMNVDQIQFELDGSEYVVNCLPTGFFLGAQRGQFSGPAYSFDCGDYGSVGFDGVKTSSESAHIFAFSTGSFSGDPSGDLDFQCVYHVSGNNIAFGISSIADTLSEGDTADLLEIDYTVDWDGAYLTLGYADSKVTYVPRVYADNGNKIEVYDTKSVSRTPDENAVVGLQLNHESNRADYIEYKYGIPLNITDTVIEDNKISITDSLDQEHVFDSFYYSGDTLTVAEGDAVSILQARNREVFFVESTHRMYSPGYMIDDKVFETLMGEKASKIFESGGLNFDKSADTPVSSGQIEKIEATYAGKTIHYKVINPFEKDIPISECTICAEQVDSSSGDVKLVWILGEKTDTDQICTIGETEYLEAKSCLTNLYSATVNRIVSKPVVMTGVGITIAFNNPNGQRVIPKSYDYELVLSFDDDILTSYSFEVPDYLYGGLQNNISGDELDGMSEAELSAAADLRDSVIAQFIRAFEEAGVDVDINPGTGVIRMNNEILFDTNKYEVKDAGKDYINDVLGVISTVVLSEEVSEYIDKVEIGGHCDVQGNYDDNYVLSVKRAEAVKETFLSSDTGFSADQLEQLENIMVTEGYSFSNPIYDEDGKPDNDKSRRVEVKIFININK